MKSILVENEDGHDFNINNIRNEEQFGFLCYCSRCNTEVFHGYDRKFYYIDEKISCNEMIIKNIIE